jgi:glycosyltransferase involved in cell wall biosynthesis
MRIVYLNPIAALGGAERSLLDMMAAVRKADSSAELHLIVLADGPLIGHAERLGIQTTCVPMPPAMLKVGDSVLRDRRGLHGMLTAVRQGAAAAWGVWRYARRLRECLSALRPDVIHSNGIKCHILTRLIGKRLGRVSDHAPARVVWHLRDFLSCRPLMVHGLRWASSRTCCGIAISRAVGEDGQEVLPHVPIEVIYNGIDTDYFCPGPGDGQRLDQLAGLRESGPNTVRVGLVATFARWKGQDVFLEAVARTVRDRPLPVGRFYIIGGPIYRTNGSQFCESEFRKRARSLGIDEHVGFIGFQEDMAGIYQALDIVVHASTQPEPFGRTIVEAMACGKPVIVSHAGGAAELYEQGYDAVGVPPRDPAALASALHQLMDDPSSRQRIGANARLTAVHHFNRERLGRQVIELYRRTVATSSPSAAA